MEKYGDNGYSDIKKIFDKKEENERIKKALEKSCNVKPIKNIKRKVKKSSDLITLAKIGIVILAAGTALAINEGIDKVKEHLNESTTYSIKESLSSPVTENTKYSGFNSEYKEAYWYYNEKDIAYDVLNQNKEYNIDTRIYACYDSLKEYKKEETIDKIFKLMNEEIKSNPDKYTEDEIRACSFDSFEEYLNAMNISKEEYIKIMKKIVKEYIVDSKSQEEIDKLISELHGGTR